MLQRSGPPGASVTFMGLAPPPQPRPARRSVREADRVEHLTGRPTPTIPALASPLPLGSAHAITRSTSGSASRTRFPCGDTRSVCDGVMVWAIGHIQRKREERRKTADRAIADNFKTGVAGFSGSWCFSNFK
jgi:hypothetical protein